MNRVGKKYLITSLVESGFSPSDAEKAVNATLETVVHALRSGRSVALSNIGTLKPVERPERTGWNPSTNEPMTVPEKTMVRWVASPTLLDVLNGKADRDSLAVKLPKGSL